MKKMMLFQLFIAIAGLMSMRSITAITDQEIMVLLEQKKAKIKPEELVKTYQDFVASIKDEVIARTLKKIKLKKQKVIATTVKEVKKNNPHISKEEVKELEEVLEGLEEYFKWDPKRLAEEDFVIIFGDDDVLKAFIRDMKDPVIDFMKLILGYYQDNDDVFFGSPEPEIKKYKEDYKNRLYQWLQKK